MIKIFSAKITDFTQADYTNAYSLLNCALIDKVSSKVSESDKKRSLAGYMLLYRGAYEIYQKKDFDISFNKNGKPLCDFCFFNISHSFDRVVCVFSNVSIGVDIQKNVDINPRKNYKFFNEKECLYVNQKDELLSKRYIEIFTKKEAAVKMKGLSLADASKIDVFSQEFNFKTWCEKGYTITVCEQIM